MPKFRRVHNTDNTDRLSTNSFIFYTCFNLLFYKIEVFFLNSYSLQLLCMVSISFLKIFNYN